MTKLVQLYILFKKFVAIKMRRFISPLLTLLFLLMVSFHSCAQPFQAGEKLIYTVKLIGLPIGTQTLQIEETMENGNPLYQISWEIEASQLLSLIYYLDDKIKTYIDRETLYPRLIQMQIEEGSRRENLEIKINWDGERKEAIIWDKKRNKRKIKKLSSLSPPLDIVSLIYWIRAQNLSIGDKFEVLLIDSTGEFKEIQFKVSGLEKVYTYMGSLTALLCEQIYSSQNQTPKEIKVWFSQDKKHIPVQIKVSTPLGYLTAILREKLE